jgi:beta-1,4-mannosyltransferase
MQRPDDLIAVHMPDWRRNPYQTLLERGLADAGWSVVFTDYPECTFPISRVSAANSHATALHLHWTAPYFKPFFWTQSEFKFRLKARLIQLDILRVRFSGHRVVWTVHNHVSHESRDSTRELFLNRMLASAVDRLIFHSEAALAEFEQLLRMRLRHKASVIPHGNYIGWYSENLERTAALREHFAIQDDQIVLLAFGAVRNYKGLPHVIEAFARTHNPKLRLIIAGLSFNDALSNQLHDAAMRDPRILLRLGFVPDEEVASIFAICHAMVLGFERILTSGSALLAMSLGKALFLPETARILGLIEDGDRCYYENSATLTSLLDGLDVAELCTKGKQNLERARALDWQTIGRKVAALYGIPKH